MFPQVNLYRTKVIDGAMAPTDEAIVETAIAVLMMQLTLGAFVGEKRADCLGAKKLLHTSYGENSLATP